MTDKIILIETSTALCSVALAGDGKLVAYRESSTPRSQASLTAPFIKEILDEHSLDVEHCHRIIPMVDARRMEVYTAIFTPDGEQLCETAPRIIDADSFTAELEEGPVLFIGDGAAKCADIITHPNARFLQCCPKASAMLHPALSEYKEKRFKDTAYFEPFYLKQFVATKSNKKMF